MRLDDPATTELRRQIIASKPFLKAIYDEWYSLLARELPAGDGEVLELGSGGGYCERYIKGLITSEVFPAPSVQLVVDGTYHLKVDRSELSSSQMCFTTCPMSVNSFRKQSDASAREEKSS
jgi:hypothetical protein